MTKEQRKIYDAERYQLNKETISEYNQSPEGKECRRKYNQSPKGKKTQTEYRQSHKEELSEYQTGYYQLNKEEILKQSKENYQSRKHKCLDCEKLIASKSKRCHSCAQKGKKSPNYIDGKGKERRLAKRRNLGFDPLNNWFEGSHAHHITRMFVVYIPREIHLKFYTGNNTEKHRQLVQDFYGTLQNMCRNIIPLTHFSNYRKQRKLDANKNL